MPHSDPERRRRQDRERHRRRVQRRISAGRCTRCGMEAPEDGGRTCERCRRKRRKTDRERARQHRDAGIKRVRDPGSRAAEYARARQRAAQRKAAGLCLKCDAPAEPGLTLCVVCGERRRAAERARYARARDAGLSYGGADIETMRRRARIRAKQRRQARLDAQLCVRCGRRPPVDGGASCLKCLRLRRAAEKATYGARRASGQCVRCAAVTFKGEPMCGPCTVIDARRQPVRNAAARRRYADRRSRQLCTHCGRGPTFGASRCAPCAKRAWERSGHVRGLPVYSAEFTVVHSATDETLGVFDHWEDAVLCLSFAGLSFEEVHILTEHAPMRPVLTGFS